MPTSQAIAPAAMPFHMPVSRPGTGCVLVVEDNSMLLLICRKILELAAHQITGAKDGNATIGLLGHKRSDERVPDLRREGGSGHDLIRWVDQHRRELVKRILIPTADPQAAVDDTFIATRRIPLLPKPYTFPTL